MSFADGAAPTFGSLIKQVEQLVDEIERTEELGSTIYELAERIIDRFRDRLGLTGGRIYRREDEVYALTRIFGQATPVGEPVRIPASYRPIEAALDYRAVYMDADDPALDPELEKRLGAQAFAAVTVGDGEWILAFDVAAEADRERILYSLSIVRHAVNQKLRQERLEGVLREARRIQASIQPRRWPDYPPFDMHARTESLHSVGGDHYDLIPITDKILGLAIADVTGHGLPAALQVRDVHMGLRMGVSRDLKIVRVIEMLNNLIHKSTLTSRFVSLFYGEIEASGILIYVNAGHPPPLFLRSGARRRQLSEGGAVLGPIPGATYERGFVRFRPGAVLVLYTDGIIEAVTDDGEYGVERLERVVEQHRAESAKAIVDAVFRDVEEASGTRPAADDRTVFVVKQPETGRGPA